MECQAAAIDDAASDAHMRRELCSEHRTKPCGCLIIDALKTVLKMTTDLDVIPVIFARYLRSFTY